MYYVAFSLCEIALYPGEQMMMVGKNLTLMAGIIHTVGGIRLGIFLLSGDFENVLSSRTVFRFYICGGIGIQNG
nr:hypothetical protein [Pasteuria penetrans]